MKTCAKCKHFRSFRPLSQLLARELGVNDRETASELTKIMKEEREIQDQEAEELVELKRQGEAEWRHQPQMSDHCGLVESQQTYLIHQIKNKNGDCADYDSQQSMQRLCGSCRYQSKPTGVEKDLDKIAFYEKLAANAASLQQGGGDQGLGNYIELIGVKKSFEAAQCHYAGKLTDRRPDYLAICEQFSTERDFIPCVVHNRNDACSGWAARANPASGTITGNSIIDDLRKLGSPR